MALVLKKFDNDATLSRSKNTEEVLFRGPKEDSSNRTRCDPGRERGRILRPHSIAEETLKEKDVFCRIFNDSRVPVFQSVRRIVCWVLALLVLSQINP